ncbi:hypothetical protein OKW76_04525 [Sphingomonas sp. S1-29]|uniref:hypothetical protein n=1 Tax=Sphingomonas sp. S1-29 TaxID=2991074 RepID=UPI00223FFD96|nr:hypothetical protein [Sphingomonas sp. S1-29]UZK70316.1 hypothetical protein OKW76_04525 [Sphingomonas sp. S1-29]
MPGIETEDELKQKIAETQAELDKAKADLAALQAATKADDAFVKLWKAYEKAQFELEATDDALRENQAEEQTRLAAKLKDKAAEVDAAVAAAEKEVTDRQTALDESKVAVAAQQAAVDTAKKAQDATKAGVTLLNDAVKLIQAKHKTADALRLQAVAARKAGNVALAYYLIKTRTPAVLDNPPLVLESNDYLQAIKDAAAADAVAVKNIASAEALLKLKKEAQIEAEKKLGAAVRDLPATIEEVLAEIKVPAPTPTPVPTPAPTPAPAPGPAPALEVGTPG